MSHTTTRRIARLARAARLTVMIAAAGTALSTFSACGTQDKLLGVDNPDIIDPANLNSVDGATALRLGALDRWRLTTGGDNTNGNDNTWLFGGLLVDEWATSSTFVQNDEADERRIQTNNSTVTFAFRKLNRVRTGVNQAIPYVRQYLPTQPALVAELYLARGFAEMQMASDFCNGIPLSDGTQPNTVLFGQPLTVAQVFTVASATLDSGIALVAGNTDTTSMRIYRALRIAKARALLGNDSVAAAGALMALAPAIPTTYSYDHTFSTTNGQNAIWGQPFSGRRYLVGDSLEGNDRSYFVKNNIPFFSAKDPRVPAAYSIAVNKTDPAKRDTTKSQDGLTNSRTTTLYLETTPVTVLNGVDARLIEAEAQLRATPSNPAGMLATLNALRAAPPKLGNITPAAMTPLVLPATFDGQVSLLFREKAFWTFSRGQRLGDLRRLIRYYGRTIDNTFPGGVPTNIPGDGDHYRGGKYGPDVNLPVPQEEENNPNFHGCIDRKP
jgi:hypothetical protein